LRRLEKEHLPHRRRVNHLAVVLIVNISLLHLPSLIEGAGARVTASFQRRCGDALTHSARHGGAALAQQSDVVGETLGVLTARVDGVLARIAEVAVLIVVLI
jgi:hypothetical protein